MIRTARLMAFFLLALFGSSAMAIEEPSYRVLVEQEDYEIRLYESYMVAETDVEGDFRSAGGKAFRILAGYIFGDNQAAKKMNMTAPVESRESDGVKMAMTVPVSSQRAESGDGMYTYSFVMESKYTPETLPVPNDSRVRIRTIESRTVAVKRYSGRGTGTHFDKQKAALLSALQDDDIATVSEPTLARYNGPMTPWFMRRNEVIVEVDWAEPDEESE
ncbi:MAG: heme-binding protein [Gammaproteobacteria bacterium]